MTNKIPYLVGAALGIVIVIAVVLVKTGGQKSPDETQIVELEQAVTVKTEEQPAMEEPEEETGSEEEPEEEVLPEEEPEEAAEKVIPSAVYVKSESLNNSDVYEEFWFDEDGDLVKMASQYIGQTGEYGSYEEAYQYVTDENGNKICGNTVLMEEVGSFRSIPNVNSIGYSDSLPLTWESERIFGGETQADKLEYKYDEKNRLVQRVYTSGEYLEQEGNLAYEEVDGETTVTATEFYDTPLLDENPYYTSWTFDQEGRLEKIQTSCLNEEIKRGSTERYEYSQDGKMLRYEHFETDDEGNQSGWVAEYEYDMQGNLTKVIDDGKESEVREYDENGNMTKVKSYNESGVWEYDAAGRVTGSTMYYNRGIEGDNIEECTAVYQYNGSGRRQLVSFHAQKDEQTTDVSMEFYYGEKGDLEKILVDGSAVMTVAYNDQGAPEKLVYDYDTQDVGGGNFSYLPRAIQDLVKDEVYKILPPNLKYIEFHSLYSYISTWRREPGVVQRITTRPELGQNEIFIEYQ